MFDRCYCINSTMYLLKIGKRYGTIFCHRLAVSGRVHIFSSPEPMASGERIGWEGSVVRRPSVRRPSTISNDFSSKTTGPIATKFHIQPPGSLGKKNCSNGLGRMTNMAAMPIYGKNLKKSSSPEPLDR